ncbi:MAG TPA: hypothetical protein VF588_19680 [Pyrinomonadaceae bacterium]|jgi:hypothetical protein
MRLFKYFAAVAALLFASSNAFADIALPKPPKPPRNDEVRRDLPYSRMSIERVEGLREARLQIPRSHLERLGFAAGTAPSSSPSARSFGTVVAGLFISLGVALTGLLLLRSRRRGLGVGRAAAAALAACACAAGLAGVAAYANAGPPPGYSQQDPGTLVRAASGGVLAGSIRVEVVEEGAEIKLLVPAKARTRGEEEE